jgi:MFS transporter, DHA1 family, multidrug resistance protein
MHLDLTYDNSKVVNSLKSKFLIPGLVFLVTTVGIFPLDVYLPSMPQMANIFGVSVPQIASTISYFTLAFALMQLANGLLSDALGRKVILLLGLFVGGIATMGLLFVKSYSALITLRVVQALGLSSFLSGNKSFY